MNLVKSQALLNGYGECPNSNLVCVATIGVCGFRCVASVAHLFYMLIGGYMRKNIQKRVIDITGVELMLGEPTVCLGNGEQGFECCCDECDYYLLCFPEFDLINEEKINDIELPPPSKRHKIRKQTD